MTSYIPQWPNRKINRNNNLDLSEKNTGTIDNIKGG